MPAAQPLQDDISLSDWLTSTAELRERLLSYGRSKIPTDPGERQLDVSTALENGQDAGDLLADADRYLSQAFARETLAARADFDAKTAAIIAKGKVSDLQRLRDGLAVTYRTIQDRRFSLMNLNRSSA